MTIDTCVHDVLDQSSLYGGTLEIWIIVAFIVAYWKLLQICLSQNHYEYHKFFQPF